MQSINIAPGPTYPVFDGTNIWVPHFERINTVTVVRVKDAVGNPLATPFVLATLTGNGLSGPFMAAFDGERIAVTNSFGSNVSLWKAADLTPLGNFPRGVCSDGLNFWITLVNSNKLVRF